MNCHEPRKYPLDKKRGMAQGEGAGFHKELNKFAFDQKRKIARCQGAGFDGKLNQMRKMACSEEASFNRKLDLRK